MREDGIPRNIRNDVLKHTRNVIRWRTSLLTHLLISKRLLVFRVFALTFLFRPTFDKLVGLAGVLC